MEKQDQERLLAYAKANMSSFRQVGVSSNEIRVFEYGGERYVLKTPLMVGERLSPFWRMMKHVFRFTFEGQIAHLAEVHRVLTQNPHVSIAPLAAADSEAMIYAFVEGRSHEEDAFPAGRNNAYRLGQYVGWNHRTAHRRCGILGVEDVEDFYAAAAAHMEQCISAHWSSDDAIDQRVRVCFEQIRSRRFESSRYALMMADISADQFLYQGDEITVCVDLDAYVIGPVEWELTLLHGQVADWDSFQAGYEEYQPMPEFEAQAFYFAFLMALNESRDKGEMAELLRGKKNK